MLNASNRGFTLIELMIGLVVMGILLAVALPAFDRFLQNTKIRNAAEMTISGLNLARAEALRRNTPVRFQMVSDLTASCTDTASVSWVVSLVDPAGACNVAPSDTTAPRIVQKRSGLDGTSGIVVAATGGSAIVYNGLGRASSAGLTQIDLSTLQGVCEHVDPVAGNRRCLRILISAGGQARMCDPKIADNTDPRYCI
jgi:type IV fimbrial biogenesis protein FimT